jgi:hypothetical protein
LTDTEGKVKVGVGVMVGEGVMDGVRVNAGVRVTVGFSVKVNVAVGGGMSVQAAAVAVMADAVMVASISGEGAQADRNIRKMIGTCICFMIETSFYRQDSKC